MPLIHSILADGPARAGRIGIGACLHGVDIGAARAAPAPAGVPQASAWCISVAPLPNIGQFLSGGVELVLAAPAIPRSG